MFNFTGTVGRQRNVNLGRSPASKKPATSTLPSSLRGSRPPISVATAAREERAARAAERKRKEAAEKIQRVWRGRAASGEVREGRRSEWELLTARDTTQPESVVKILALFWGVVGLGKGKRVGEVRKDMVLEMAKIIGRGDLNRRLEGREGYLMRRFLEVLSRSWINIVEGADIGDVVLVLNLLPKLAKTVDKVDWESYFMALAATIRGVEDDKVSGIVLPAVVGAVSTNIPVAYKAFAEKFLTTPGVLEMLGPKATAQLQTNVDLVLVRQAITESDRKMISLGTEDNLWLLAHILYLTHQAPTVIDLTRDDHPTHRTGFSYGYLPLVSYLLYPVAGEIRERMAVEDTDMDDDDEVTSRARKEPLPPFVKSQIGWLIKQESVLALLQTPTSPSDGVKALSRYAINLLIAFPSHRAEIRMWLNLAKTQDGVPALRYVWDYVKQSVLFSDIKKHETNAKLAMKQPPKSADPERSAKDVEDDLNVVFLFLEIYGFLLSVTDDNEFFANSNEIVISTGKMAGRQLRLDEVKDLTVFLKNLGFAMYFYSGDIMESDGDAAQTRGWELKQFRDVVTSVMRAIYARE